jgi:DNA-binding transcriptional LysR family regulator
VALARVPQLDPHDIKLLRVFAKIVESGGFSEAQAELNVSAATISTSMAALESRLGMRLCDRGRVGFKLTNNGQRVWRAAEKLEEAINLFRAEVGELRGKLVGDFGVGIADSTVTNPELRLHEVFSLFVSRDNALHITLHVNDPDTIERKLLEGKLQVGISAFYHHVPGLNYEPLLREKHSLYCGHSHKLFGLASEQASAEIARTADYVRRGYMGKGYEGVISELKATATAYDMEATLVMIRSGAFIGHLPSHYARDWVERGEIWEIPCERYAFHSEFEAAHRSGTRELPAVRAFLDDLRKAHDGASHRAPKSSKIEEKHTDSRKHG